MSRLVTEFRQPSMERYQVILAYDGSHYKGFQRQAKARSVQGVVEDALRKLNWSGKSILAAGRTDTGVHALGQVIAFDLDWRHSIADLRTALNSYLPSDVVAKQVKQVCPSFHPRFDATWRRYLYRIYCQPLREPLLEPYAWRVWPAVEINDLQAAAAPLAGTHDFGAFGTPPQSGGSTMRMVLEAGWKLEPPYRVFAITGQAFLYHMVRRLVFMQVAIAQGRLSLTELDRALLSGRDFVNRAEQVKRPLDRLVHGLAPAQGLVLVEVQYPPEALRIAEDKVNKEYYHLTGDGDDHHVGNLEKDDVQKTYIPKKSEISNEWVLVDAKDKYLGRLATQIATILLGKNKPNFTPGVETGDYVIVINAETIKATGNKMEDKVYYHHSGYPSGIKSITLRQQLEKHPERVIRSAVWGMLPHNKYGRSLIKKMKVYVGPDHPHQVQNPRLLD